MIIAHRLAGAAGVVLCTTAVVAYAKVTVYGSVGIFLAGVLVFAWGCGLFEQNDRP